MREYMPKRGALGRDMMFRSCTVQVNLDYESERDMVEKMRIGMALQVLRAGGGLLWGGCSGGGVGVLLLEGCRWSCWLLGGWGGIG